MPLYEYRCQKCGNKFEALTRAGEKPICPACSSDELERMISPFIARSGSKALGSKCSGCPGGKCSTCHDL